MKYALISDIHEDMLSLKRALVEVEREGCDEIICLGDVLGFSPSHHKHGKTKDAAQCLELVQQHCSILIPGNHDLHAIEKLPQPGRDFRFPENWYSLDMTERKKIAAGKVWLYDDGEEQPAIPGKHKEWLAGLPEIRVLETPIGNILLSHYVFPNLSGALTQFYHKTKEFKAHRAFMEEMGCSYSIFGHLHYPGLAIASNRMRHKRYNRNYTLKKGDCIAVPPVLDTGHGGSMCIFNTEDQSLIAKRY